MVAILCAAILMFLLLAFIAAVAVVIPIDPKKGIFENYYIGLILGFLFGCSFTTLMWLVLCT